MNIFLAISLPSLIAELFSTTILDSQNQVIQRYFNFGLTFFSIFKIRELSHRIICGQRCWHKNRKARKVYSLKPTILVPTFHNVEKICVHKNILDLIVLIFLN